MRTLVDKQPIIKIAAINVINGLFVNAKIEGKPIINKKDPILWKRIVFSTNFWRNNKGL